MSTVDRKHFVPESKIDQCYIDTPLKIGWNTTISAPHMHAITIEALSINSVK
jgi:protein-L-isoaspartate(D-aspartate) O-methyltransferase